MTDEFEYDGFHFYKVGTVPQNMDFDAFYETNSPADAHIISSGEINPYFAENFLDAYYKATGEPEEEALVFTCMETGGRWVVMDSGYDSWLEEYNGPVVTNITPDERFEMLQNTWRGYGSEYPKDIFTCCDGGEWLAIDNTKGEFLLVEFSTKAELDDWLETGTLPSNYICQDVRYPSDPSEIDFLIDVGKNKYVTVRCKIYEGFYVLDNSPGGRVTSIGVLDDNYHFSEEAAIDIAKRECKKRFPQYFKSEPKHGLKPEQKKPTSGIRR